MRSVYTVGELIQYAPVKIDSTTFNLLRAIVASEKIDHDVSCFISFSGEVTDFIILNLDANCISISASFGRKSCSTKCSRGCCFGIGKDECCRKFVFID